MMTIPRSLAAATLTLACFLAAPACSAPLPVVTGSTTTTIATATATATTTDESDADGAGKEAGQQQPAQRAARFTLDDIIALVANEDPEEKISDAIDDARDAGNGLLEVTEDQWEDIKDAFTPMANAVEMARGAANDASRLKMPRYGKHCGTGKHSNARGIDEIDECCKQHDRCTCTTGPKGMWFGDCDCEEKSYRCMVRASCPKTVATWFGGGFKDPRCLAAKNLATKFFEMNKGSFCETALFLSAPWMLGRAPKCL